MDKFYHFYICAWSIGCLFALIFFLINKTAYEFYNASYWRFLCKPWKITTFVTAALGMTILAPYTSDPTWDYLDASVMSILTFLSAPWVVGALYKVARNKKPAKQAFVAVCFWLFSSSWFYDLYLLIRDGNYPLTWWPNLFLSSVLYLSAGLLWNLDYKEQRGVVFSFMENNWPTVSTQMIFPKIIGFALPFMLITAFMIFAFVFTL